ncbi:MAG TPA: YggS family pyridoxal phosphate-dependent enzyme [Porticoccaceae bacterium]|nr:YggS family pyridoxal phosphate-dependent enzyme [Porticoccaceae bacterium]
MSNIETNVSRVLAEIQHAAQAAGRNANAIALLAVGKGQGADALAAAYRAGLRHFGESYLQEALAKMAALRMPGIEWHFLGPVQANKTRGIAEHFSWLHSLDRLVIAERLARQRPAGLPPLQVCLQVNIDREPTKSGVAPEALEALALAVAELPGLRLRGLMAIPRERHTDAEQRAPFRRLAELLAALRVAAPRLAGLDTLSMGMSADLRAAVAEGATIVRVGQAIFGPRPSKPRQESPCTRAD